MWYRLLPVHVGNHTPTFRYLMHGNVQFCQSVIQYCLSSCTTPVCVCVPLIINVCIYCDGAAKHRHSQLVGLVHRKC